MKKINLIVCAVAVAFAGALVSCQNQPTEMNDVTIINHLNSYDVSGTVTTTTEVKDVSTSGADGKENGGTYKVVKTVTAADTVDGTVSWAENAVLNANYDNMFAVSCAEGDATSKTVVTGTTITNGTSTDLTTGESTYDSNFVIGESENKAAALDSMSFDIVEIEGACYVLIDKQKVAVTADLTSGETFTLKFSYTDNSTTKSTDKDKDDKVTGTSESSKKVTVAYDLKFTAK